jgi:hypothetical protein
MFKVGISGFNCKPKGFETPLASAVKVTLCEELTDSTLAANVALVALAGTVIVVGTVTPALLLERVTISPPLAAAVLNVTMQESVPGLMMDALVQERALNAGSEEPVLPVFTK